MGVDIHTLFYGTESCAKPQQSNPSEARREPIHCRPASPCYNRVYSTSTAKRMKCPFCGFENDKVVDSREQGSRFHPTPPGMPEVREALHYLRAHRRNPLHGGEKRWTPRAF